MFSFTAVGQVGPNQGYFTGPLGLALRDLEASPHRDIDIVSAAGSPSRPAQQACIKHPFGADQHQPPGITAIPVVHVCPSRERSLLLAAYRGALYGALSEYRNSAGCHRR